MLKNNVLIEVSNDPQKGDVITLRRAINIVFRGNTLSVPKGYTSDGASVPRMFWRVVFPPLDSKSTKPAIGHDYIYETTPEGWTRLDADNMFYLYLLWNGTPFMSATLAYIGVRLFGWLHWGKAK